MMYALIGCLIIVGFLGVKLFQKRQIDQALLNEYNEQLKEIKEKIASEKEALTQYESKLLDTQIKCNTERNLLTDIRNQLDSATTSLTDARDEYHRLVNERMAEIDMSMEAQRIRRQQDLDSDFETRKQNIELELEKTIRECDAQVEQAKSTMAEIVQECIMKSGEYHEKIADAQERFNAIEHTLAQYEKDKQAKLFYTIQLPEEYHEDIEFLLTAVAAKVQHPDIISKLVWAEYVKPNLDDTFKRIEIKPEPGIYKITNIDTGKCYIGKSTNVKARIADHFKSSIGIKSIADQAVHHAILKEGFWNWTIEVITYCDKDKLSELEKYYIDFFKSQELGYNKNSGG